MKRIHYVLLLVATLPLGCVDLLDLDRPGTVNVVVVDATLTDQPEPQIFRFNRSKADEFTGRFGTLPLTGMTVSLLVDGAQTIPFREVGKGSYYAPDSFRAVAGRQYELHFTLADGQRYVSAPEVMPAAPPIQALRVQFNPNSLPRFRSDGVENRVFAAHDFFIDFQDAPGPRNYYRWDWRLWERQPWCRTCTDALYAVNNIVGADSFYRVFFSGDRPLEECFARRDYGSSAPISEEKSWTYDYLCRTQCWEILRNFELNLFDDALSNGGFIQNRRVAQIPFVQQAGALVELRQASLTQSAHQFFLRFQQQTQNTGGVADTPPTALVGNVRNVANPDEYVIGTFAATGVATQRYWLDRRDATGPAPGLFSYQNARDPNPELDSRVQALPFTILGPSRPPTAVCVDSDFRTPIKPAGWRDN